MRRKVIYSILGILIVGLFAGAAYAHNNQRKTPAPVVQQKVVPKIAEKAPENQVVKTGQFKDVDAIHRGSGTATIITTAEGTVLRFEDNFAVTPGPDLFVYASPNVASEGLGNYEVIGKLQSFRGGQVYNLPPDFEKYKSIVIWCRSFGVT
ncbi:MAG TPA: DM13 domain-containing protein, partial [Candidatus Limnocylindrales bacterium]|nr:DM13 domain-containing protein [Candidatus Limnocylindrales bacterium]